jgi:hypothetical protein
MNGMDMGLATGLGSFGFFFALWITERHVDGGGRFGTEGLKGALEHAGSSTAASTAMAIQQAVTDCWQEALEDDATVVVMAWVSQPPDRALLSAFFSRLALPRKPTPDSNRGPLHYG